MNILMVSINVGLLSCVLTLGALVVLPVAVLSLSLLMLRLIVCGVVIVVFSFWVALPFRDLLGSRLSCLRCCSGLPPFLLALGEDAGAQIWAAVEISIVLFLSWARRCCHPSYATWPSLGVLALAITGGAESHLQPI